MNQTMERPIEEQQYNKTAFLYRRFQENGDLERVEKAEKLLKKMYEHEFITAFSGHFSAGKSTMINELIGEQILPSSPIPTSANLVKVHEAGEEFAKVYYKDKEPLLFQAPYDFDEVKAYCKSGNVEEVEIGKTKSKLPENMTVMDTPGIDSTDDAHRLSTESAIHLADIVFYVMDYNHVQSELNFFYTKELLQHGANLFLIINQIDKHNENELSFSAFKQSVHDAFAAWDVVPNGIFFTSLRDPDHPHNEFGKVKEVLAEAVRNQTSLANETNEHSMQRLMEEHLGWLEEEREREVAPHQAVYEALPKDELQVLMGDYEALKQKEDSLNKQSQRWTDEFEESRTAILKSAYLMPFETRQLAEDYLESVQPEFKVGFLMSKKKTEEERTRRRSLFYDNLREIVEKQLEWHIREELAAQLVQHQLSEDHLEKDVQAFGVPFSEELLQETIKSGARLSGEYVLQYCEDLSANLKKIAVRQSDHLKEQIAQKIQKQAEEEMEPVRKKLQEITRFTSAMELEKKVNRSYEAKAERLKKLDRSPEEIISMLEAKWKDSEDRVRLYTGSQDKQDQEEAISHYTVDLPAEKDDKQPFSPEETANRLESAAALLAGEKVFERSTAQLAKKAERLKHHSYTIALFGAFSAGKSSFANALLGDEVLPVSPNPTTAAINRICPPDGRNPHGTAVVMLKPGKDLLEDVQYALKQFGRTCSSLEEAYQMIPSVHAHKDQEGKEQVHLSFLHAFQEGYGEYGKMLGESVRTDLNDFRDFVANESQSCFVDRIDLYYDCAFTRKGITLVDTPGADSINARHTGVAFEYIKNADAILFVTYYNHAFSKADREFLIQLGRVKDAFELDKMFFIINAVDLASSVEEKEEVIGYVTEQLNEYGIRFPRVFGLSSKLAISEDTLEASYIDSFYEAFYDYLEFGLSKLAVQSAEAELMRAFGLLEQMIESACEDVSEKAQKRENLLQNRMKINGWLEEASTGSMPERISQEGQELVHYVKQRVFFRLPDFFKEAFNPAVLQKNSKDLLNGALEEYLASAGFDFAQELRATSIRMENYTITLLRKRFEKMKHELMAVEGRMMVSEPQIDGAETMDFQPAFKEENRKEFESSFKYFKNPRSFFEGNEKKHMEEALQESLSPLADRYLEEGFQRLESHYHAMLNDRFSFMISSVAEEVNDHYEAWLVAYEGAGDLEKWQKLRAKLAPIVQNE